jgi:hypothetical protein
MHSRINVLWEGNLSREFYFESSRKNIGIIGKTYKIINRFNGINHGTIVS